MSDEHPVPETLETIAASIRQLKSSMDVRFDELKAQLRMEIETVDGRVRLVYDEVIAQRAYHKRNAKEHATFVKRLDDHDTRILALERKKER